MPEKDLGGRPRKEINIEELKKLCGIQATARECAYWFDVSEDTIDRRVKEAGYAGFADFYKKHNADGLIALRRAQMRAAIDDRNPTMLVWMGKQVLGQKDKVHNEHTGEGGAPMKIQQVVLAAPDMALPESDDD